MKYISQVEKCFHSFCYKNFLLKLTTNSFLKVGNRFYKNGLITKFEKK